jgi:hypothetical protein
MTRSFILIDEVDAMNDVRVERKKLRCTYKTSDMSNFDSSFRSQKAGQKDKHARLRIIPQICNNNPSPYRHILHPFIVHRVGNRLYAPYSKIRGCPRSGRRCSCQ